MAGYTRAQLDAHRAQPIKTPTAWAAAMLQALNVKQTPGAMQAMVGWARAEGGHWNNNARYNPLNTTQPEPGAGNTGSQGNIKVYTSWDQGIKATVATLKNGRYGGILTALKAGDPAAVASAIGQTPWGTSGGLVQRTIMGTPAPTKSYAVNSLSSSNAAVKDSPPTVTKGGSTLDTRGAIGAALSDPRKGMSLASRILEQVQSGNFTTTVKPAVTAGKYAVSADGGKSPNPAGTSAKGTTDFEGTKVAAWIAPALAYARAHGWKGKVNSGFRSLADQTRIYNSGVRPAAKPGTSNHEGADFPRGAVDVSEAAALSHILAHSPYAAKLQWAGAKDPVHFSHPHNGSY